MPTSPNNYKLTSLDQQRWEDIKEMLAVAQINYIRHEVNQKNVARRIGTDPRTVSKYANQAVTCV